MTQQYAKIGLAPDVLAHQLGTDHDTALFVIRAVNSHDDLLAALKWFSNRFHTIAEVAKQWAGSCSMSTAEWQDWEARVLAVTAKAEEGS